MNGSVNENLDKCEQIEQLDFLLALYFSPPISDLARGKYIKCLSNRISVKNQVNIQSLPVDITITKEKRKLILSRKKKIMKNKWSQVFLNLGLFENSPKDYPAKLSFYAPEIKKMENEKDNLLTALMSSYLYHRLGNTARANELLNEIFELDVLNVVFKNYYEIFSEEEKKVVIDNIFRIISYFENNLESPTRIEMLKIVIKRYLESGGFSSYLSRLSTGKSLQSLREQVKRVQDGLMFPTVWFPELLKRASYNEAIEYFEKSLSLVDLKVKFKKYLWLFEFYFPRDKEIRKLVIGELQELYKSKNVYEKYMFFRLIDNEIIRNNLSSINKKYNKPLFLEKRKFYKQLLHSGEASEFALYHLIKLGDMNKDYILWVILR